VSPPETRAFPPGSSSLPLETAISSHFRHQVNKVQPPHTLLPRDYPQLLPTCRLVSIIFEESTSLYPPITPSVSTSSRLQDSCPIARTPSHILSHSLPILHPPLQLLLLGSVPALLRARNPPSSLQHRHCIIATDCRPLVPQQTFFTMSGEMSGEAMQTKIATARRDAEGLKDKIKRKKDELADTSCKLPHPCPAVHGIDYRLLVKRAFETALTSVPTDSTWGGAKQHRRATENRHESTQSAQRPLGQNIRDALVHGPPTSRLSLPRWQADHLGCVYNQQSPRHTSSILVGHDLRLCP